MPSAEYQREWRSKHPGYYKEYQRWLRENQPVEVKRERVMTQKERYRNDPVWRAKKLAYNRAYRLRKKLQKQEL